MNGTVKKFDVSEEAKIIPAWSVLLGIVLFTCMQLLWNLFVPHHARPGEAPPFALRIFMGLFLGTLLFVWSLLIGYVNRDSKRRGMSRALWTIIAIFVPNGVGFILYFLLRDPLQSACPKCGTLADSGFTFCPRCRFELRPTCPACSRAISTGDLYCASCGADVAKPAT